MRTSINQGVHPTGRELRWFAHIGRHGPQSSEFLYELTRNTHRCKDTSLRRLQALREAGYLHLPIQQRQIIKADFNPYVYDLTKLGWDTLAGQQKLERHCRPTGHWWHGYWVSSVASAIEISATRAELEYIPAARILAIKDASAAIPTKKGKVVPDQLFAIKYVDGYRTFALEVDRGTEPIRSTAARKSLKRSVGQYREILKHKTYGPHYGLKSNLFVLWVFSSRAREIQFRELLQAGDQAFVALHLPLVFPSYGEIAALVSEALSLLSE